MTQDTGALFDRLLRATALQSDDAAIRITGRYEPQAGAQSKVSPPTYALPDRAPPGTSRYVMEDRWDEQGQEVSTVLLDSVQSQANRAEVALAAEAEALGLPQIVLEVPLADRTVRISSLEAPHRSRDAYLLDSEVGGVAFDKTELGAALNATSPEDASALLRYAPYDLVFGVWDSHRGKRTAIRFARSYVSEVLGWHVLLGNRAATKGDPLNLPGGDQVSLAEWRADMTSKQAKKGTDKLSSIGHGMIPGAASSEAGGVSVQTISRQAVLSLTGVARLRFGADAELTRVARAALATVALLADRLAFARAGLSLRSGCDLLRVNEALEWVQPGGRQEALELPVDAARDLVTYAREQLARVGVEWSGEPYVVAPRPALQAVIERTFYVPELEPDS